VKKLFRIRPVLEALRALCGKGKIRSRPGLKRRHCPLRLERLEVRATPSADLATNIVAEIMEDAPETNSHVAGYLNLMRADGSFTDLNYRGNSNASAEDLMKHGVRMEELTEALKWNDASNSFFNSAALKTKVVAGFNYLATKAGSVSAPNWWYKAIGVPQYISDGLMLVRSDISANTRNQILSKYFSSDWNPSKYDGANIAYQAPGAMIDGVLRGDMNRVRSVVSTISKELSAYSGEGIQRDLSFHQHGIGGAQTYYSGHYGIVFAHDTARIMRWTSGTTYAFGQAAINQELSYTLDSLVWLSRGAVFEIASQGRTVLRPAGSDYVQKQLKQTVVDLAALGSRPDDLARAISRFTAIDGSNFLSGNIAFYKSDAIVNQRLDMMTTVKLLSTRVTRPETAMGENLKGFFEGDGFTMFVKDGDEFGTLGAPKVARVWDWQRLPGTTVEHNGVIPYYDMFKTATSATGASNLVGGVSDGFYGVASMNYARSQVTVTAKKAWFFFDNEVVMLGADIDNSSKGAPVYTSLNQVLLDGPIVISDAAGQRTVALGGGDSVTGTGWIAHDGMGYVILDPTSKTMVQAQVQSGNGASLPVFSAWVDHGKGPQNATYAYVVVPNVTADSLGQYATTLPLKVLANTANVQAVQNATTGVTQIAFYTAGTIEISPGVSLKVDKPVNLIVKQDGANFSITAADPKQTGTAVTIDVGQRLTGPGASFLADGKSTRINFSLPTAPLAGSSLTRTFQLVNPAPTLLVSTAAVDHLMSSAG